MSHKPIIGFSTGDINGIGPEIIIKLLSDNRILDFCTPVIFGSNKLINFYRKTCSDHTFSFTSIKEWQKLNPKQVNIFNCWEEEITITPGALNETGGKYAIRSLEVATLHLKEQLIDALITAPIHKANTHTREFPYTGHTPYFKKTFAAKEVIMLLYDDVMRVALATEHVPVQQVSALITKDLLNSKLSLLEQTLIRDFGITKPRIAVLGLNPHAGDGGAIGKEEQELIIPAIEQYKAKGKLVFGPYSADAFFARRTYKDFDAILAMYHDQGLIPFKSFAESGGINFTAGLPVIRTSPDHGTAFDIAGKNQADERSIRQALFAALDLIKQRKDYAHYTANPLQRGRIEKENV